VLSRKKGKNDLDDLLVPDRFREWVLCRRVGVVDRGGLPLVAAHDLRGGQASDVPAHGSQGLRSGERPVRVGAVEAARQDSWLLRGLSDAVSDVPHHGAAVLEHGGVVSHVCA